MPLHWHVNAGPVAYSRPMRKSRKKAGPLTTLVLWFTVKPLELMVRGIAKLFSVRSRSNTERPVQQLSVGWYLVSGVWVYWNGQTWYAQDGRPMF